MTAASATRHRDLRTGQAIWSARRRPAIAAQRSRAISRDAVVVGAGISGALIAEALSEAGLGTVVVDRRGPAEGSTAASTAMLQYELDTPLADGRADRARKAERIWRRSRQSVDALRERTERLGLAVDGATRGSIYLDGNILDADGLAREADTRRRAVSRSSFSNRPRCWSATGSRDDMHRSASAIIPPTRAGWPSAI